METQVVGIPSEAYRTALKILFDTYDFQLLLLSFGVIVVILLSLLAIWKHAEEGRP